MQGKARRRNNERQVLDGVVDVRDVPRSPKKRSRLRQELTVEDYLECVVEARKTLDDGQTRDFEGVLAIPDTWETRSVSEYSQDKHAVDEDDDTVYWKTRPNRSSSGSDALRTALVRFCVQFGLEKDSRNSGAQR